MVSSDIDRLCATQRYTVDMRTITQRELRNDNAQVIRAVEQGESFVVTKHGTPVAHLTPLSASAGLPVARPAKPGHSVTRLPRVTLSRPSAELIDDLRGDR